MRRGWQQDEKTRWLEVKCECRWRSTTRECNEVSGRNAESWQSKQQLQHIFWAITLFVLDAASGLKTKDTNNTTCTGEIWHAAFKGMWSRRQQDHGQCLQQRKHLWQTTGLCNCIYVYVKCLYNSFSHCADEHDTTNMPWQHVSANNPSVSVMRRAGRKGKRPSGKKKRGLTLKLLSKKKYILHLGGFLFPQCVMWLLLLCI